MGAGQIAVSVVVDLAALAMFLGLLSVVSRRLLGVRIGRFRILVAALIGLGAEFGFESQVVWQQPERRWVFIPIQIGIIVGVALLALVLAELLVPSGSWPRPDKWLAAVRSWAARTRRYWQISRIAVRHSLFAARRPGRRPVVAPDSGGAGPARHLRLALQEAGVTFVKLGQLLSTRSDLLPPDYLAELSLLQQRVEPVSWEQVQEVLTTELGRPLREVFAEIAPVPLAAASIGQVHRARLLDGTDVAVKVQRPGIRPIVAGDLDIALRLARTLQDTTEWGRTLRVTDLAADFAGAVLAELDFRNEARNIAAMTAAARSHPDVRAVVLPRCFPELSTGRVLVMQFLDGSTLSVPAAATAHTAAQRAEDAALLFHHLLRQVLLDGVFHADPHPGNIMLLTDGRVALIDFGSVGRIDADLRAGFGQLLAAVDRGDPRAVTDALLDVAIRPDNLDEQTLHRTMGTFMAEHLGPGTTPDADMFTDLIRLVTANGLAIPGELATAFRALAVAEGTLRMLSPSFDIVEQSRSFAAAHARQTLRPESLRAAVNDELQQLLPQLRKLPRHIDQLAAAAEQGRLSVRVRLLADPRDRKAITSLVNLVILAFLGGMTGLMATLLLSASGGPQLTPTMNLFQLFGYIMIIVSGLLLLRVMYEIFRRQR
jgi:ubiquinone biosynthesis protein